MNLRTRIGRFATWVTSSTVVLSSVFGPLIPHALAATDPSAAVVLNEIVPDSGGGTPEFIELYNRSANSVDVSRWTLASASDGTLKTFPSGTVLEAGGFLVETFSLDLDNKSDTVSLTKADGSLADTLSYGTTLASAIQAPEEGKALARRADGFDIWYSNLSPTKGLTNGPALSLQPPVSAFVQATDNNPANMINQATASQVIVQVSLPPTSLASDRYSIELHDGTRSKLTTVAGKVGGGLVQSEALDTTEGIDLADGELKLRLTTTDSNGVSTNYVLGTNALKDTVAPDKPEAAAVLAEANLNGPNLINLANVSSVKVGVILPDSAQATDQVKIELTDEVTVLTLSSPAKTGGGVLAVLSADKKGLAAESLKDGTISVRAQAIDAAGNRSDQVTGKAATKDTLKPVISSLSINDGATVTAAGEVKFNLAATDGSGTGIKEMRISEDPNFSGSALVPFDDDSKLSLSATDGLKTVRVQVRDGAGNFSDPASASILLEKDAQKIDLIQLATGTQTVRELPVELEVTAKAPTPLTLAEYASNPGANLPSDLVPVGKFREVGSSDPSKLSFPLVMKFFYSTQELAAAGVARESQILGIAFFDQASQTWKLYGSTGVNPTDQTVAGQTFAGFAFANADHLTPMVMVADTAAPAAPSNLKATTADRSVTLTWDPVTDATSYLVRLRVAGSSADFTTVAVLGTSAKITGLNNGTSYEFGVAAVDKVGNSSSFSTITATPEAPLAIQQAQAAKPLTVLAPPAQTSQPTPPQPAPAKSPAPTVSPSPSPSPTATKSPAPTERAEDLSRLLVTLAILVIAIGAGTLGYYGYQWWATRPEGPPPPPPPAGGPTRPAGGPTAGSTPSARPEAPKASPEGEKPPSGTEGRW